MVVIYIVNVLSATKLHTKIKMVHIAYFYHSKNEKFFKGKELFFNYTFFSFPLSSLWCLALMFCGIKVKISKMLISEVPW